MCNTLRTDHGHGAASIQVDSELPGPALQLQGLCAGPSLSTVPGLRSKTP
jgi:hypothetical protein